MSDDHSIIEAEVETKDVSARDELHPMVRLLSRQGDLTTDAIERLMAMQERYDALEAERVFRDARAGLLDDLPPVVAKNKSVRFAGTHYTYADLPQIIRSVMSALKKHGFSISWTNEQQGRDEIVTCHLSHRGGHEAQNTRRGSVEPRKGQSGVQSSQSTVTYLQRQSLLALLGIVTDDMPDADEQPVDERLDTVDVAANLNMQSRLRRNGLSINDAEEHVGAGCRDWTREQLDMVRSWARSTVEARTAGPIHDGRGY